MRGLSGSGQPIELPCLVDQANCGEVYYITWTRQQLASSSFSSPSSSPSGLAAGHAHSPASGGGGGGQAGQWSRVYLYTGANDSAPHKPIGDLLNRANFVMPDRRLVGLAEDEERAPPLARLVIEEPRLSDEALYKCDVTYVKGKCPSISLVRVQMLALPAKAQIQIVSVGNELHESAASAPVSSAGTPGTPPTSASTTLSATADGQLIGPYNERDQLRLSCLVFGGRPQPKSVIWRKIDPQGRTTNFQATATTTTTTTAQTQAQQTNQNQRPLLGQQAGSLVQVELNHTLTSADLGAKFECHVEHEALEQQAPRVVVLNSGGQQQQASAGSELDQMLDLHPARVHPQLNGELADETGASALAGAEQLASSGSLSLTRPAKSLDAHVYVDLNGK